MEYLDYLKSQKQEEIFLWEW